MKLNNKELLLLEESLDSMMEQHKSEIEEIHNLDDSYYQERLKRNQHRRKQYTIEDLKEKDIKKELDKIKEIKELKKKLLLSDNYVLVISNLIKLTISDK